MNECEHDSGGKIGGRCHKCGTTAWERAHPEETLAAMELAEKMTKRTAKRRASFLPLSDFFRLDYCCRNLDDAFGHVPYLVGSVLQRADFRDVDLRLMLPDETFKAMFPNEYAHLFLNMVVSDWLKARTGLPIDFQFQDHTEANKKHDGPRNPMGCRAINYRGKPPSVGG